MNEANNISKISQGWVTGKEMHIYKSLMNSLSDQVNSVFIPLTFSFATQCMASDSKCLVVGLQHQDSLVQIQD